MSIASDYEQLCHLVVKKILAVTRQSIRSRGRCSVALSGGTTPGGVYALMAAPEYQHQFEWLKIDFFMGDERYVPLDDPLSNYKMVTSKFKAGGLPLSHVRTVKPQPLGPQAAAALYERQLMHYFNLQEGEFPHFDLVLLGIGADGHVASLFPNSPALGEKERLVVPVQAQAVPSQRLSLTLPVINAARNVFFIASGPAKAPVIQRIFSKTGQEPLLPVQMVQPSHGRAFWFLDKDAMRLVPVE